MRLRCLKPATYCLRDKPVSLGICLLSPQNNFVVMTRSVRRSPSSLIARPLIETPSSRAQGNDTFICSHLYFRLPSWVFLSRIKHIDTVLKRRLNDFLSDPNQTPIPSKFKSQTWIPWPDLLWQIHRALTLNNAMQVETEDNIYKWLYIQPPREKSGTRKPLEPSRRNGMPFGLNSSLTSDMDCKV